LQKPSFPKFLSAKKRGEKYYDEKPPQRGKVVAKQGYYPLKGLSLQKQRAPFLSL